MTSPLLRFHLTDPLGSERIRHRRTRNPGRDSPPSLHLSLEEGWEGGKGSGFHPTMVRLSERAFPSLGCKNGGPHRPSLGKATTATQPPSS